MQYTLKIARETKDPNILINILRRKIYDRISLYAVGNHNCPKEMLVEIIEKELKLKREYNNGIPCWAALNPNCPSEILVEILRRGKDDDISRTASHNPNCPLKEKIEWMQLSGKIGKEDLKKHIIEYEKIKEDDFQDLKDLL